MGSVTDIATALVGAITAGVADVDYGSITDLSPAITTQKVACLCLPFGQRSETVFTDMGGGEMVSTIRLRLEFWVKHASGTATQTMQRARDISHDAMVALIAADGTGYDLAPDAGFSEEVDQAPTAEGGATWLVATLIVPVMLILE